MTSETVWPDVYCPSCRARPGEPCITSSGRAAPKPHKPRTATAAQRASGGAGPVPPSVRSQVGHRSGGGCEFVWNGTRCPRRAAHLHHRRRRSQGGDNTPENLVHLCSAHHDYVHAHPEWSYDHGYLARTEA